MRHYRLTSECRPEKWESVQALSQEVNINTFIPNMKNDSKMNTRPESVTRRSQQLSGLSSLQSCRGCLGQQVPAPCLN